MLEALLRVQDFEAFEMLLGLLERTPLSARERRELLAEMYLRRGFAASAARRVDGRLPQRSRTRARCVGLARVAVAQGNAARGERLRGGRALARSRQRGRGQLLAQARGGVAAAAGRRMRPAQEHVAVAGDHAKGFREGRR